MVVQLCIYLQYGYFFAGVSDLSSEQVLPSTPVVEASKDEPHEGHNLFQTFANMSNFSFSAMAAASKSHPSAAFGVRRDDAVSRITS